MSATQKHSSITNEHYTPEHIIQAARTVMGGIDFDPASSESANKLVRAKRIMTYRNRGTTLADETRWKGRVFCNPPGGKTPIRPDVSRSNPAAFWWKLRREWEAGRCSQAIFVGFSVEVLQTTQLLPDCPSALNHMLCIPRGRVKFDRIKKGQRVGSKQPPNASVIVYLPPYGKLHHQDRFAQEFGKLGEVRW